MECGALYNNMKVHGISYTDECFVGITKKGLFVGRYLHYARVANAT